MKAAHWSQCTADCHMTRVFAAQVMHLRCAVWRNDTFCSDSGVKV
jgi:hypothetical protein